MPSGSQGSTILLVALAVAMCGASCGGREGAVPADGGLASGDSSTSGGSSGSSSGSSGSVGSSGSSSGSTAADGSTACTPLEGCNSSVQCPAPDGCNTCVCDSGQWECGEHACAYDGGVAQGAGACTAAPPTFGAACPQGPPYYCGWTIPGACGESCLCNQGVWSCKQLMCGLACPPERPAGVTGCNPAGAPVCDYAMDGVCGVYECACHGRGDWLCQDVDCTDAGAPMFDASEPADAGVCPTVEPAQSSGCTLDSQVCTYNACPTNCLCANGEWVCAKEPGCP